MEITFCDVQSGRQDGDSARTVRFYIARGLLDGPGIAGRGASYGPDHLERLRKIRQMQQRGLTLTAISREREGRRGAPAAA